MWQIVVGTLIFNDEQLHHLYERQEDIVEIGVLELLLFSGIDVIF